MLVRLARHFGTARGPWMAALLGMVLCAPALGAGLVGDDYLWWLIVQGEGPLAEGLPPLLHVYNFIPGGVDPDVLRGQGMVSWWADPALRVALLRPLTAATFTLDHAIAPHGFALHHLHSLAWYGLAVALVGILYRRIHPGSVAVAGLATLLFAVEDAHAMNAGWLANRHALLSLVAGVAAFLAHLRWRREGRLIWLPVALLALAAGLLCGESALGAAAYLVAWQLALDRATWARRLAAIAPYAVLVVAWRLVYDHLGYGISGSDLYVDPGRDPLAFAGALLQRWPELQLGQWFQVPVDVAVALGPAGQRGLFLASLVACVALAWFLAPLLRRSPEARFWALGMSMSLVPLAAAFPMDRLLVFAGIGAFGLLAMQAEAVALLARERADTGRLRRWLVIALLLLHLPLAALGLLARTGTLPIYGALFAGGAATAPEEPGIEEQTFVFVTGHEFPVAYTPIIRAAEDRPSPGRTALLATIASDNRVFREDRHTLVIEPELGFLAVPNDRLERRLDRPFAVGDRVEMPDYAASVLRVTEDGRPAEVAFRFHEPLESPRYCWLIWGPQGAETFPLPAVGDERIVPAPSIEALFARPP